MKTARTRREFLAAVGQGMMVASVGAGLASDLGLASARADEGGEPLSFGPLEPLVALMQETPIARLLPTLVEQLNRGTELKSLLAAGALANARTFGGEDYVGFHTMMALAPSYHMARELPEPRQALPVLKVLYRNSNRIQEHGGRPSEVLKHVAPLPLDSGQSGGEALRAAVHARDIMRGERMLVGVAQSSPIDAFNDVLYPVQETSDVHRIVMPYRAWDLLGLIGQQHAETLLRQSVRYCIKDEAITRRQRSDLPRTLLPKLMDQYHLAGRTPGDRAADDAWVAKMSETIFTSTPEQAAEAAAGALAEGFAPDAIGEAISLAANQLVLRDAGRPATAEIEGKPIGSVHGDSIGVHASDSANAWRSIARIGNARNVFASLILGAHQVALDRVDRGGDFLHWDPLPVARHLERLSATDPDSLLKEADRAIRGNLQARACAVVHRYGQLGHPDRGVFDLLLGYAVSEDGALHAEKYYRTVSEEFASTRPAFRWRQLTALARVTASEYGRPAAGCDEARELLRLA
ncbi:MAG TPA: hypothetical protein VGZ26_08245 [Pirellulales bacterium]|nr:hypothetical protein [Pirellulales bacterium]